ncbi:MAG: hypothetical protein LW699_06145 [Pirellula sp.]|nr:hypothetical protein [Pirellula sp.]
MKNLLRHLALSLALAPISGLLGSTTFAADTENGISTPKANVLARSKKAEPAKLGNAKRVAMFDAMDQGLISVEYIGKDSKQANIIFRNKSDESIDVVLPETFGAVPVVAQGMGMGGMMRVEPDRPRKVTVATLCLEHGKADPTPRMKYRIVRLSEVNANPEVAELCKALAQGKVPQNTAQAAAWHIANGLSWEELASKPRMISQYTGIELYFSNNEIQNALRLTGWVSQAAAATESHASPGDQLPSSGESALLSSPGESADAQDASAQKQ